jgi:cytochrome P450
MMPNNVQAREALVRAFVRYYEEDGPVNSDASPLIPALYKIHSSNGVLLEDMARLQVAISVAIISNTMPASFWLIYHIFSDPVVLEDCRKELSEGVRTRDGVHTIDIIYIKNQCPVFLSTFQETFHIHSTSVASRVVLEDHVLNGQYLLQKGGVVLIPASVQHSLDSAWGSRVDKFYHKRFLQRSRGKGYNPVAFRAFGGGSTLSGTPLRCH